MLTSIILALSVSATPVAPADTQDLLQQNNVATPEVVARKSIRIARKSIRIARKSIRIEDDNSRVARKSIRIARKSIRIEDNNSAISTQL
ncbi:MAG: hypothetical protein ACPG46_06475 [Thalassotalea sp.]